MQQANGLTSGGPKHLNKAFLQTALQNGLHEQSIEILKFICSAGTNDGDNYCSQIYRVSISYTKNRERNSNFISVILKVMPDKDEFLNKMNVFNKEKWLIAEIIPQFEILLNDIQFAPRCYYFTSSPLETLVLEDMQLSEYQMANRELGLDERHAKLALRKLGQFHAASMVFAKKRPSMMQHYSAGIIDPDAIKPSTSLYRMFRKHLLYEIKYASQWNGYEEVTEKLQEFYNNFQTRLYACQMHRDNDIKVLNHGDFWVNNFLFKYDSRNNPVDLVFLDFQTSIYGSLGFDLNFFLFSSLQLNVLRRWKVLLEVYYVSLRDSLVQLGYDDIPSQADIEKEFKKTSSYGLFTVFGPLPVFKMEKESCAGNDFDSMADSDEKTETMFKSPRLIECLKYSLLELDKLGALDA